LKDGGGGGRPAADCRVAPRQAQRQQERDAAAAVYGQVKFTVRLGSL